MFAAAHQACSLQGIGSCNSHGPACATKTASTTILECSTPVGGYWLDQGIATSCESQTGCATDDTNTCTTGADVTKLKCTTLEAGYKYLLDESGIIIRTLSSKHDASHMTLLARVSAHPSQSLTFLPSPHTSPPPSSGLMPRQHRRDERPCRRLRARPGVLRHRCRDNRRPILQN